MRRSSALLLALLALAAPLGGCGGDDDGGDSTPATGSTGTPGGERAGGSAGDGDGGRDGGRGGGGRPSGDGGSSTAGERRAGGSGPVDLTVDPGSIRGARVTATGAVQTVPPSEDAHRVAIENGYSSINNFGEEATGQEATDITFALVQYLTAKAEGDWATACARLYSVLRESIERSPQTGGGARSCPQAYGEMMSRASEASRREQARIDVSSVRRGEDNRAFVIYKTPETLSADMPMYVEEGVWKVGALEAYVLTPGQVG